ncbi:ERAD-associated E3 ubiquitin-protein ligase component HRD3A [Cryptomeria japonica]|uniref:ERAD-associated E3 ubiquitin-protein ligase component HRD3A n=1 Tax=Cryptomeria japonica TaxID=3369 RepID=UPI0027DA0F0D|nr:ERAD-associated E3 ubiquitin-protein ligase component HRD3A [Cryptomeria japonica]
MGYLMRSKFLKILFVFLLVITPIMATGRHIVLVLDDDDALKEGGDGEGGAGSGDGGTVEASETVAMEDSEEWDEFGYSEDRSEEELDPGSWRRVLEDASSNENISADGRLYVSGLNKMMFAVSEGDPELMKEAVTDLQLAADGGHAHAQSTLGFLYGSGNGVDQSDAKAFLYHHFAAEGGNFQSKMALAYIYHRQQMHEKSVKLYAELAAVAVASFFSAKESPLIEPVRINDGAEENKEALRKSRGEEDDDFQIIEYQAQKGNAMAMYRLGIFYYFGLRGVRRDHAKALIWFHRAVEKGDSHSMEFLGEIYARGSGVERNYTKALEWLKAASRQKWFSAYNGIGYLYVKGQGVDSKNFTKAKEYFKKAAEHDDPNGHYSLGVLYLKGMGVKKDVKLACRHFITAANTGQPKAFYQLGKMFHNGIGLKKDLAMAAILYKLVAERGPCGSLLRWALECYLKGQTGKALLLYSRVAELGYEVAQSNAAWILDKYGEYDICIGKSGFCSDVERHQRAHTLWWHASEQGNEHAALLIGDAYYYGRGTDRDFERAAEAYMHAHSQGNAQAMFNLGFMHEHGEGLPLDLHLAKRYYDQALETDAAAKLPVMLALMSVWLRKNYTGSSLVALIDSLPDILPRLLEWLKKTLLDDGNVTILTLVACLLTVLYLRDRQRRIAAPAVPQPQIGNN